MAKDSSPSVLSVVALNDARVEVAQVEHRAPSMPRVLFCGSFDRQGNEVDALKDVRAALPNKEGHGGTLLSRGQYGLHQVEDPNVPAAERAQAVRWKLQEQLDYPAEQACVDVVEIPSDPNRVSEGRQLFAFTARESVIRQRIEAFHAAKLPLSIIDVPEMAQRNIAHLYESDGRAVGVLSFMEEGSLLTFSLGGELLVAREFDVTLQQLLEATDTNFEPTVERVALEIQRTYDHVDRRFNFAGVARIMVSPLPPDHGAIEYLNANLSVRVQQIDLKEVMDLSSVEAAQDLVWQTRHMHVLGAAMRQERVDA